MTVLKWGILTAGKISHDFTIALQTHPETEHQAIGVAASKLESAKRFAKNFNIPNAYGSYQELLLNKDIDVVYIGTIHPYHYDLCKLAINANKHIVCEKPAMLNERQLKEILELCKVKKLFFLEAFWSRFFPSYEYLREQIKQGAIGDVKFVQASFGISALHVDRLTKKELGGGALLDLGCYPIQFANMIFKGKPEKIIATGQKTEEDVDLFSSATLYYPNNCAAVVTCNMGCELTNRAVVSGTKGKIEMPMFWCATSVTTPSGTKEFPLPKTEKQTNFVKSEGFHYEQKYVRDAILQGKKECDLMPHADSLQIIQIMDEIRKQLGVEYDADKA